MESRKSKYWSEAIFRISWARLKAPCYMREYIFIMESFAIFHDLKIFKIDIISAYLNTPLNDDVEHKWLLKLFINERIDYKGDFRCR